MRALFAAVFICSTAWASQGDILLTCTRTSFRDLQKIVISESDRPGEILVTEYDETGSSHSYVRDPADLASAQGLELSGWYGYTRRLYQDSYGWAIEHADECGGGNSFVTCK